MFREIEFSGQKIKNFLIFFRKKLLLIFREIKLSSPKLMKLAYISGGNFPRSKNKQKKKQV